MRLDMITGLQQKDKKYSTVLIVFIKNYQWHWYLLSFLCHHQDDFYAISSIIIIIIIIAKIQGNNRLLIWAGVRMRKEKKIGALACSRSRPGMLSWSVQFCTCGALGYVDSRSEGSINTGLIYSTYTFWLWGVRTRQEH